MCVCVSVPYKHTTPVDYFCSQLSLDLCSLGLLKMHAIPQPEHIYVAFSVVQQPSPLAMLLCVNMRRRCKYKPPYTGVGFVQSTCNGSRQQQWLGRKPVTQRRCTKGPFPKSARIVNKPGYRHIPSCPLYCCLPATLPQSENETVARPCLSGSAGEALTSGDQGNKGLPM